MEGLLEFGLQEELAKALQELAQAAAIEPSELEQEFHDLFIGITRGELLPYGSWYLSGSLHGASLARLREDLHALGIEREPKQPEPEDHIAAISEVLALLIKERDARQREVFAKHLAPWASRFFDDLEKTHAARFYRAVAKVGKIFLGLESRYLGLER
ncbi:MAG: molecular chaperone TorD family protein [Methylohalobius sp.]|nr:molecular chaperone TorD family protein [Methylohalobius sp.]